MKGNIKIVLSLGLFVIYFVSAIPQTLISTFDDGDAAANRSIFSSSNLNSPISDQSQPSSSQILSKCLCVPYYRCDPGHWEKTEDDHCKRFMYICCYGPEAVEFAENEE